MAREIDPVEDEYLALIRRTDKANHQLAIFIHGYFGNYLATWGYLPRYLTMLDDIAQPFCDWDYLFLGYKTLNIETYLDIAERLSTEWTKAQAGTGLYKSKYNKCALFAHSLGTLGVRQLLCSGSFTQNFDKTSLKSVTLFGVPLNGSVLARIDIYTLIAAALRPGNPQLRMLNNWVGTSYKYNPWPMVTVVLGEDDKVVGNKYGDLVKFDGDRQPPEKVSLSHSAMVKPTSWQGSSLFAFIQSGLR